MSASKVETRLPVLHVAASEATICVTVPDVRPLTQGTEVEVWLTPTGLAPIKFNGRVVSVRKNSTELHYDGDLEVKLR